MQRVEERCLVRAVRFTRMRESQEPNLLRPRLRSHFRGGQRAGRKTRSYKADELAACRRHISETSSCLPVRSHRSELNDVTGAVQIAKVYVAPTLAARHPFVKTCVLMPSGLDGNCEWTVSE